MSVRSAVLTAALLAAPVALVAQTTASSSTAATAAAAAPAPVVHPRVGNEIELGRKYTEWLYTGRFDSLFTHMSEDARKNMESASAMASQFDQFTAQVGDEMKVLEEKVVMRKGNPQYWRTAEFSMSPEPVMIRWVIVNGEIWGIGINPASQAPPIDPVQ
jgi:phosphate-selective porin